MRRHPGAFYIPPGLRGPKHTMFAGLARAFAHVVDGDIEGLDRLPDDILPVVSCRPGVGPRIRAWQAEGRPFLYWDRGYVARAGRTSLTNVRRQSRGYLRWTLGGVQMRDVKDRPAKRWRALGVTLRPWCRGGGHIVIAAPSEAYADFHHLGDWTARTIVDLRRHTDRPITVRHKTSPKPLQYDLAGAHCLVTHASIAAVEAAILGTPVFVDPMSAAAPVGRTDLALVERPARPDREPWAASLAYGQFTIDEVLDGTMWRETVEAAYA